MSRHIMAVCVVCLLCADRLPCQNHTNDVKQLNENVSENVKHGSVAQLPTNHIVENRAQHGLQGKIVQNRADKSLHNRRKRHVGHSHETIDKLPDITDHFLERIMTSFEHDETMGGVQMGVKGFQQLIEQLGLQELIGSKNNSTCVAETKLVQRVQAHDLSHSQHHHNHHHELEVLPALSHESSNTPTNCTLLGNETNNCAPDLYEINRKRIDDEVFDNYTLSAANLLNLCPVLLYQLASPSATERAGCIDASVLTQVDSEAEADAKAIKEDIMYVWIYSFISVFACGILGLVGVAIIPFMDSRYYKHIIQYLVSLAVGTMTGDALLHLLPHSLAGQSEKNMIFKGLTCMGGIIFFYITEHGLTMISEWRKSIEKKETKKPSRAKVMRDPDSSVNNSVAGDKMCKQKYSSYPYCYDEIAMDHKQDVWMHLPKDSATAPQSSSNIRNGKSENEGTGETAAATQSLLSTSLNHYAEMNHQQHNHCDHQQSPLGQVLHTHEDNTLPMDLDCNTVTEDPTLVANGGRSRLAKDNGNDNEKDTVTVILREHESSHHGHSHRHGHVHSPPESLSAVAWMIIMGDGLHNFTDGMAIGAAFAENIAGGFSTSLAVFCHELPHELGDFAILIKAGMSIKSAVYYNLLTGVLSFIGMIFGIVFGQSQEAAQWMFAAAAGLFIYIALVDMMPEISAAHKSLAQFALQIFGMLSGVLIMLTIAIYEGDLMTVFTTSSSGLP